MFTKYFYIFILLFLFGCKSLPNEYESNGLINYLLLEYLPSWHEFNTMPNLSQQITNAKVKTLKIRNKGTEIFIKLDSSSRVTYLSENKNVIFNLDYSKVEDFILIKNSIDRSLLFKYNKKNGIFEKFYKDSGYKFEFSFSKECNNIKINYYNDYINFTNKLELQEIGYNNLNFIDRIFGLEVPYILIEYDKKDYTILFNPDNYYKNNEQMFSYYINFKAIYFKVDNSILIRGLDSRLYEKIVLDSLSLPKYLYKMKIDNQIDTIYFNYTFYN